MNSEVKAIQIQETQHLMDSITLGKIVAIRDQILAAMQEGKSVYRFESGDPSFPISEEVASTIIEVMKEGKTHYPPSTGIIELREVIRSKLVSKNQILIPSIDSVFITHGAMNAIFSTIFCIVNPGDEVIIPDPMWPEIAENIKIAQGIPVRVKLSREEGYQYLASKINEKLTSKTRAIYLNTPHNPTGTVLSKKTLKDIVKLAKEHGLWIISDEAYEHILYEPEQHYSIASLSGEYIDKVVSIFSFSKSYAMSGLRLGYIVTTSKTLHERLPKILRCVVNGANSITQWAGITAITKGDPYIETMRFEYRKRRDLLFDTLKDIPGIKLFFPKGAFFLWVELLPEIYQTMGCQSTDEICNLLAKHGVGSIPGDTFGHSNLNYIRLSYSCDTRMVEEGALVLRKLFLEGQI